MMSAALNAKTICQATLDTDRKKRKPHIDNSNKEITNTQLRF